MAHEGFGGSLFSGMKLTPVVSWTFVFVLGTGTLLAQKGACSRQQAIQADAAVDTLKTWNSVYRFYKQHSACDDGGIAEGVSESVAKLLANKWESFGRFVSLASRDKGFENFVVRHVDETIDWGHDAPKIHENAQLHCPPNATRLCKILVVKTTPDDK